MLLAYQVAIFTQIFLYCWFGNEVIVKSENFCYSAFKSNWYECSESVKKIILFYMLKTQKPIILFVGDLFPISVTTFTSVSENFQILFIFLIIILDTPISLGLFHGFTKY